jgi:glycosyltransferase involved in cell wall biosynthesis
MYMKILILTDYYLPGYKAGGPIQTLSNIIDRFGDEFEFKVLTRDRDLKDKRPYKGIVTNSWQFLNKAEVLYLSPSNNIVRSMHQIISNVKYDLLYVNSFFSPSFGILPIFLNILSLIPKVPIIIAPRGQFAKGSISIKWQKKFAYLSIVKLLKVYRNVVWHASSKYEAQDIQAVFGDNIKTIIAPNMSPLPQKFSRKLFSRKKNAGHLKIIFLSRIAKVKNLDGALRILKHVKGNIEFNIYGPLEDHQYWQECQQIINCLPGNIAVKYHGPIAHSEVRMIMSEHDLHFLPTLGENFGHVILESFSSACPVLISDRTPWKKLEKHGAGWDIPLEQPEKFKETIQYCVDLENEEYQHLSRNAYNFGLQFDDENTIVANRNLFRQAETNSD